jgi:glutamate synthase domain-containing protein 2
MSAIAVAYWYVGLSDMKQSSHAIQRNFPVLGHARYFMETLRPEIRQYFIEDDDEAIPFSRESRSLVYQRAKNMTDTVPLGTRMNVYEPGYEWVNHSIWPTEVPAENLRVVIGGPDCTQPYSASLLNVSAMSYGALSDNAILALNGGAKLGNFYHNTGEGGISRYHKQPGGDIVWNIGTGYFGCRDKEGKFSEQKFIENATLPQVRMIEVKLSQGAKPGHGGILPKSKVTPIIAEARGVPIGEDCNSPPIHSAFEGPKGLIQFISKLRTLSGGKPVGFKLCVGHPAELAAIVRAMVELNSTPDFITVDGGEGGTGAAPQEYSNHVGTPLVEGLTLVHNLLTGAGLRDRVKIISAGKIFSGFTLVRHLALGSDICNAARAMMYALGCIQALKCNTNKCPTGVATQDPELMKGLVVDDKVTRVYQFQNKTLEAASEIIGSIGLNSPQQLRREHLFKRISADTVMHYGQLFPYVSSGSLLDGSAPTRLLDVWKEGEFICSRYQ